MKKTARMNDNGLVQEPIDRLYVFLMEQIIKRYREIAAQTLEKHRTGLSVDEWIVLKQVSEQNGCSQIELARSTLTGPAKMTRTIDALAQKKLITKKQSEVDRRRHMIFVSEAGKTLIEQLWPDVLNYRRMALRGFSPTERETLHQLLSKMVHNLEN